MNEHTQSGIYDLAQTPSGEIITEAIKQTQNDKSPDTDGLTYEFYKAFWHLLGKDLVQVFSNSFEQMRLPNSQNYGLLTLLFKKGERALLGTLCNQDVAIGRRLMVRHLATTSYEKASRYLIPTQRGNGDTRQPKHALEL